jgi:hypothetical protein
MYAPILKIYFYTYTDHCREQSKQILDNSDYFFLMDATTKKNKINYSRLNNKILILCKVWIVNKLLQNDHVI